MADRLEMVNIQAIQVLHRLDGPGVIRRQGLAFVAVAFVDALGNEQDGNAVDAHDDLRLAGRMPVLLPKGTQAFLPVL